MSAFRVLLLAGAPALAIACTTRDSTPQAVQQSAAQPETTASDGLKILQGPGFTLSIPREAIVTRSNDSTWKISAPRQVVRATIGTSDTTTFENDTPLYELEVAVHHKAPGQSLKAWGDSLLQRENVGEDYMKATGRMVSAAGQESYLLAPYCGDCGAYDYYFARGGQVVEVAYSVSTAEPLAVRKNGVYALLLSTFRWTH